jgi:uncharacterized membrane protein
MLIVTLYCRKNHPDCLQIEAELENLQKIVPHQLVKIDIESDRLLEKSYKEYIPVIEVGPYQLTRPTDSQTIKVTLQAAQDRINKLDNSTDQKFHEKQKRGREFTGADRFSYWFSNWYMVVFNFLVLVYVGLPFMAPVLNKIGYELPAKAIYTIYKPLCHQLAYRSWFLFGSQVYYPRELAHQPVEFTYEEVSGNNPANLTAGRKFIGDATLGYKVAICERDVAIYGSILLFGILFNVLRRRIKPLPILIWIIVGIIPIALDGFSQIPGLAEGIFPTWLPIRESTPFLRSLTGTLFGFSTAWFMYPLIEEAMRDTRLVLIRKKAVSDALGN